MKTLPKRNEKRITICCVNWFSCRYLHRLFANLIDRAAEPRHLKILVVDNTGGNDPALAALSRRFALEAIPNNPGRLRGSCGHAAGLNLAMSRIDTPYAVVVDPDVHIFKPQWDAFLLDLIDREHAVAAGATYPPWQLGKYHHFPNPVFCFFKTDAFLQNAPDWTPFRRGRLQNAVDFLLRNTLRFATIVDRRRYENSPAVRKHWPRFEKMVGLCSRDTGWRNAEHAARMGIKSICFSAAVWREVTLPPAFQTLARQFELYLHGSEPVLAHKYGTASRIWTTARGADESFWRLCIRRAEASARLRQG